MEKKAVKIIERYEGNETKQEFAISTQKSLVFVVDEMGIQNMKEECLANECVDICYRNSFNLNLGYFSDSVSVFGDYRFCFAYIFLKITRGKASQVANNNPITTRFLAPIDCSKIPERLKRFTNSILHILMSPGIDYWAPTTFKNSGSGKYDPDKSIPD